MNRATLITGAVVSTALLAGFSQFAQSAQDAPKAPDAHAIEFFEKKVRPLLFNNCFGCHGPAKQMGGMRLDSLAGMLKGNSAGPVVVLGHPDNSPLIQAIRYNGKIKMPPTGKLKPDEIEALTEWVRMGAPWPGQTAANAIQTGKSGDYVIPDSLRNHWSFKPVRKPSIPRIQNLKSKIQNPIDAFHLAQLEKKRIPPNPPADKRTLIRRAYIDLTGLPPTADEIDAFVADASPNAFVKIVDKLLESPRYGERWARYWMDVARYSDTKGYVFTEDRNFPNAYTFRDYVIRAFNDDLPYDRFVMEQIAADRLPLGEDRRPLAAMGYLTVGRRFLNQQPDIIDARIALVTRGFQGLTVGCARCHDHKYDPIPTADYYSLYGVFASSMEANPPPGISPKVISEPYEAHTAKLRAAEKEEKDLIQAQIRRLRQILKDTPDALTKETKDILQGFRVGTLPDDPKKRSKLEEAFEQPARDRLKPLRETMAELKRTMPTAPEFGMAMEDRETPVNPRVFVRGNPNNHGPAVPRQFLLILAGTNRTPFTEGSGRLDLAKAIVDPKNPLTARVMVNRIWMHHFGQGIVRTPSDLGTRGEPPTHPELLDWLAAELTNPRVRGTGYRVQSTVKPNDPTTQRPNDPTPWSIKHIHRLIMSSAAYQQSSACDSARFNADPENRLISRMNRRRMDLEAMRDSMLAVSGRIDLKMAGPSVDIVDAKATRRSVYGFIERQNLPGFFRTFDFASPDLSTPTRARTTVPQQALFMMNSPFVVEQAKALANRPEIAQEIRTPQSAIRILHRLVYGRNPSTSEIQAALTFISAPGSDVASLQLISTTPQKSTLTRWEQLAQVLLMSNEFTYVD